MASSAPFSSPNFVHLEPRSYKTVQSRGFIAKTDKTYQNAVANQAHKLRVFLEPPTKPLDPAHPSEGFVAMQNDNNKEVMCQVINQLCRDKVIFQHSKNLNNPAKIRNVKDILIEFNKRGYLDDQGRWSAKIDCPDLKAPHVTCQAGGRSSTEDLTGQIHESTWSSDYCQKYLPGCAEERKPDIILVPYNPSQPLVQDWRRAVSLVEMKQHGVRHAETGMGMEDDVAVVVKDTWVDLTAPPTEGMILKYLQLKGVIGVTWLLFEGLVAGPAIPPSLDQLHNRPGIGTVYNQSFLGVSTLVLAHKSMTKSVNAYNCQHPTHEGSESKLELVTHKVYQERMLTQSWLYPLCACIYEFSCVYKVLVGIADCIKAHGQAFSPYRISENGSETDELFPISFMQADTSMWNMGLNSASTMRFNEAYYMIMPLLPGLHDPPPQKQASCQRFSLLIPPLVPAPASAIPHALSIPAHTSSPNTPPQCPPVPTCSLYSGSHSHSPILNVLLFHFWMQHLLPWSHHSWMFHLLPTPPSNSSLYLAWRAGNSNLLAMCPRSTSSQRCGAKSPSRIAGYGSTNDLKHFADKGGIYELMGTRAWMAIQMMLAQRPGTDVIRREIVHDLEGYYYVILTLAFHVDVPYRIEKVPNTDMARGQRCGFIGGFKIPLRWRFGKKQWKKQHYLGTDAGFSMVEGLLGEEWVIEPVKTMLKEMREHLFTNAAPTHSGMLDIIINALVKICTNPDLAHLCQPQQMTMEWAKATGGNGIASRSSILPAL
ncbi:hypothetical protein DFH29DRAFT_996854 [Suillus ampliporus]|nr:hypothetical protein DFH29DRAFT_996854 [Suillus ampliporus]